MRVIGGPDDGLTGGRRLAVLCYHSSPVGQPGARDTGGMNVYVRESSRELARFGWSLDIFTRDDGTGPAVETLSPGARLLRVAAGPAEPLDKQALPRYTAQFAQAIAALRMREGTRYDLIHSHYWLSGVAGLQLQRRWNVPHVTMFHTLGEVKNRARLGEHEPPARIQAEEQVVRGVSCIVCATEHERGLLRSLYHALDERVVTIPCGVDVERFHPQPRAGARLALGLADGPLILYVGRLEPLKGLDIIVNALQQLDRPHPTLLIVGGDGHSTPEVRRLKSVAARAGVADSLRFVGAVPQSELPAYYAAADVCVIPSFYESFGMVALEAQACGTPVVASRVGGLPGAVRDGETGYLVPWRCPEPFAERLDLLLRNAALRESLGRAARTWAEQFRWSAVAERLDATYQSLLASAAAGTTCEVSHGRGRNRPRHIRCEVA